MPQKKHGKYFNPFDNQVCHNLQEMPYLDADSYTVSTEGYHYDIKQRSVSKFA